MLGHQLVVHEVSKDYRAADFFNPVGAFSIVTIQWLSVTLLN